jgi:hypothetical protein
MKQERRGGGEVIDRSWIIGLSGNDRIKAIWDAIIMSWGGKPTSAKVIYAWMKKTIGLIMITLIRNYKFQ